MGKIYELFGTPDISPVRKLPNKNLGKSIASGVYGMGTGIKIDKSNPAVGYLMDEKSKYNIEYWNKEIDREPFLWVEMHRILRHETVLPNINELGFCPMHYGVKTGAHDADDICAGHQDAFKLTHPITCTQCHALAIRYLYKKYKNSVKNKRLRNNGKDI